MATDGRHFLLFHFFYLVRIRMTIDSTTLPKKPSIDRIVLAGECFVFALLAFLFPVWPERTLEIKLLPEGTSKTIMYSGQRVLVKF